MGHSSIQMTFDTYGHLFEQAQNDASGSTETEESSFSWAYGFDKLNDDKNLAGGSCRYSGIGMSETIH